MGGRFTSELYYVPWPVIVMFYFKDKEKYIPVYFRLGAHVLFANVIVQYELIIEDDLFFAI